ncbi:hypothetical protein FMN50_26195 [Rhodobacterales bacterium]|nr:hypothetical protein FMN50_26195 [Rhodobacterales bacterium]
MRTRKLPNVRTFSLYLAKSSVLNFQDILTDTAREKIDSGSATSISTNELGDKATVYIFQTVAKTPNWITDLSRIFENVPNIKNKSSSALLIFLQQERIFITPFAHGWQYIDDTKIETDFGLKVAVNSLNDAKLKRIDCSHLGEAMKGVSQSAFQRDIQSFGIDEALDLVMRITGTAEKDGFAKNITGSTALKISKEMAIEDLDVLAEEALARFKSSNYKNSSFHIIDKVTPIRDKVSIEALDSEVLKIIKSSGDNFELSMPGWSEDDVVYYGFFGPGVRGRHPDLLISHYRAALGQKLSEISTDTIANKHGIVAEFNNELLATKRWSIKKALIGSITFNGGLYAISEGQWYRLDQQFKIDIDEAFDHLNEEWDSTPEKLVKRCTIDNKKSGYEPELDYNRRCAKQYDQICLDQEILTVPSIPYGRFEACDLIDIKEKRIIHVKKSSRQSSVLSHFFKQGSNSAKILKTFPEARDILVSKIAQISDEKTATECSNKLGSSMAGWKVEFHIIDAPRIDGSFKIPFFSRITLRDECRVLQGMGFQVAIRFIPC